MSQISFIFHKCRSLISLLLLMITLPCYGTIITTIAGSNIQGYQGDGGLARSAQLNKPLKLAIDPQDNLLIADTSNSVIRQVNRYGIISTFAGTGTPGYRGDGNNATSAQLNFPEGIAVDHQGMIYIADTRNHVIRRIDKGGTISTFAGTGQAGHSGNYKSATLAQLNQPTAIAIDSADNVYIADTGNSIIRKIDAKGIITTVAGTGQSGMAGDGQLATRALLNRPEGLAIIGQKIYIADTQNAVIRMVDDTGIIRTFSGTGDKGSNSDAAAIRVAQFHTPTDIVADSQGNLYIVDTGNSVIDKIDTRTGTVAIIAGNRTQGYSGDGREAIFAQLNTPKGIAVDDADNIYISDSYNHVIRKLSDRTEDSANITPLSKVYNTRVNQAPVQVDFSVTDVFGNPLTAQEVYFFAPYHQISPTVTKTDNQGRARTTVVSYNSTGNYPLFAAISESYVATQTFINVQPNDPPPPISYPSTPPSQPVAVILNIQVLQGDQQQISVNQTAEELRFVVKNASGTPIRGQKVTFTVQPDTKLSAFSAVTDTKGEVVTQFNATPTVGNYVITARLDNTDVATTAQIEVLQPEPPPPPVIQPAAVPQTLTVTAGDAQIIEVGKSSGEIRFSLKDDKNQAMAGKALAFSVTPQGRGITPATTTTDANGEISLIFNAVDATGDYLITAQLEDSLLAAKARLTVFKPVPILTATRLVALNASQVVEINNSLPIYFTVLDNHEQPLAGQTVLFNLSSIINGLSVSQAVSDRNGQVSTVLNPTYQAGDYTVTANVINTGIQASSVIHSFIPDKPQPMQLSIAAVSGQNQTVLLGQNSQDITFRVTTPEGSPVVKRKIFFSLMPNGAGLAFTEASTDMQGYVSTHVNSTTNFGNYRLVAMISDTDTSTMVSLEILDTRATLSVFPEIQQIGLNHASAPTRFIASYRNGQPIVNQEIIFTLQPSGHGLSNNKATTDAQGQVSTAMQATDLEGRYVVTAMLGSSKTQAVIQVTAQPQSEMLTVTAGAEQHTLLNELSQIVTFTVTDGAGQPLVGRAVNFTITPATANLITQYAVTDIAGRVSTRLDKNTKAGSYLITAATERATASTTIVTHPMVGAVMKQLPTAGLSPDSTQAANLSDAGFFSGVFINNQLQENVPISSPAKIMVAIKDSQHTGNKTNIYITAKKLSVATRARAAATDTEWMLIQDTEQPQTWQWQPWDGNLNNLQPTESNVYLTESVTQYEYPTEFPSEGEWAIAIGYSPPVVETETPAAIPSNLITTEQTTAITVDNMPSLGESAGLDKENNPIPSKSLFTGGISIDNASYVREATTLRSRSVQIEGNVKVETAHVGYLADIIVVVAYKEGDGSETFYMMQSPNELLSWDGNLANLLAFKTNIELPSNYPITLYTGNLPVTGELRFYFGYRLSNGSLIFTPNSINAKVDDETQMPALGATRELGKISTNINSFFVGGVSQNGQIFVTHADLPQTQQVQVTGVMNITAEHVGKEAELLIVVGYTPPGAVSQQFFMQDAQQNFQSWSDLNPATLVAKQRQTLESKVTLNLYSGALPVTGTLQFYFGYRLVADGSVFYPDVPIAIVVQ